jgi:hypothetical protein
MKGGSFSSSSSSFFFFFSLPETSKLICLNMRTRLNLKMFKTKLFRHNVVDLNWLDGIYMQKIKWAMCHMKSALKLAYQASNT